MNDSAAVNAIVGARIARARESEGMSVDELARCALLDAGTVEGILSGTTAASFDQVVLLAGALGIEVQWLMAGIEWVPDGKGGGRYRVLGGED